MYPTWTDERRIINRGRLILFLLTLITLILSLILFKIHIEFTSFWLLRIRNRIHINLPYVSLILFLIVFVYMHVEPFFLFIRRYSIHIPKFQLSTLKIAHISDTHIHYPYPQVTQRRMNSIIEQINDEKPDIVVFTGDLMSDNHKFSSIDITTLAQSLQKLKCPLYICFGNHDVENHHELLQALLNIGAIIPEQQTVEVNVRNATFYISGLQPSLKTHETNRYIDEINEHFHGNNQYLHILLAHMPDAADHASDSHIFDIQLSGHSHGGQCVLPLNAGAPFVPPGSKKYTACTTNIYQVGEMILHISRGVGVTPLPFPLIRFLCPPEISILTVTGTPF